MFYKTSVKTKLSAIVGALSVGNFLLLFLSWLTTTQLHPWFNLFHQDVTCWPGSSINQTFFCFIISRRVWDRHEFGTKMEPFCGPRQKSIHFQLSVEKLQKKKKKLGGGGDGGWWGEVGGSLNISSLLLFHREPWHCLETVQRSSTEAY